MKSEKIESIKNDPVMMMRSYATCQFMNDSSGMKLFASILKENHGLDVNDVYAVDAFLRKHFPGTKTDFMLITTDEYDEIARKSGEILF